MTVSDARLPLLAELLKAARERKGMSQLEAGHAIYRSDRKIRFLETGEQMPDLIEFLQLIEAYEYDPVEFLLDFQQRYSSEQQAEHATPEPVLIPQA